MYRLYGTERSGSAAIEMALARCQADYRLENASSWQEGSGSEALKALNPLMQIPTLLLADGAVLTESAAILIYLGLEYPLSGLLSNDADLRAQQIRGLIFISSNCYAAIGVIDYPERWLAAAHDTALSALKTGATQRLHQQWETFSDIFSATAAWRPDDPGALEMLACVVTRWSATRRELQKTRPEFYAALTRIDRHPTLTAVLQRHWPAA